MDTPSSSTNGVRQKRVQPSRSRRGGPGVGSCDADLMILETQKRKLENEPLIPASTQFLLTTNSALVAESSKTLALGLNAHANYRYFDRPEVLKAYREQQIIQTPEFVNVADIPSVGGRFRPRGAEDGNIDTSDAAYEKRHRKYETFEKRQRLREKEKLKHEQYKLKERIEQLRAMDGAAFLALPASSFSPVVGRPADEFEDSSGIADLPGAHVNGAAAYNEGERRRNEMLDVARTLEARYRVLLPPERLKKSTGGRSNANDSVEPEVFVYNGNGSRRREEDDDEPEVDEEPTFVETAKKEVEKLKLRIRFPPRPTIPHSPHSVTKSSPVVSKRRVSETSPLKPSSTRRTRAHQGPDPSEATMDASPGAAPDVDNFSFPISDHASSPRTPMSNSGITFERTAPGNKILPDEGLYVSEQPLNSTPTERPHKRVKTSALPPTPHSTRDTSISPMESISAPVFRRSTSRPTSYPSVAHHISYAGAAGQTERTTSLLMVAATRTFNAPKARKAMRHLNAFGTKVPLEIDEVKEFELPSWVYPADETEQGSSIREVSTGALENAPNSSLEPALELRDIQGSVGDVP